MDSLELERFELWTEKYRPKCMDDIVGNEDNIQLIKEWFDNFQKKNQDIKRALLLSGPPGLGKCLAEDTPVVMYNGQIKMVQFVKRGDELMGDDGTPRKVLSICTGHENMYQVRQDYGDPYTVNESHVLSLKKGDQVVDIDLMDFLNLPIVERRQYLGYKALIKFGDISLWQSIQKDVSEYQNPNDPGDLSVISLTLPDRSKTDEFLYRARSLGFKVDMISENRCELSGPLVSYLNQNCPLDVKTEVEESLSYPVRINFVGHSKYYGFELSDNGRFLLGDFTVTHNTTLAHAILKEYNYQVKEYNASDVRSKKLVNSNLYNIINIGCVDKLWNSNYKEFGIIMDEVDGMSSGDKGGMAELIQFINPNRGKRSVRKEEKLNAEKRWIPPIICICNNNYDKKIMALKKDCLEVVFKAPKKNDLVRVIDRIGKSEKMKIDPKIKENIAEYAQGDFRRLIFLLQHLYAGLSDQDHVIDKEYLDDHYQSFCKKEIDLNSYDTVNTLLNKYQNPIEALKIYETDKSKLPMMIHENYIDFINLQDSNIYDKLNTVTETIDNIINGDIIDKAMYNNQSWYLQPIHGLYSCYLPCYHVNSRKKTHYKRSDKSTALTNYSFNCANKKNINQIISMISKKSSYDTADIQLLSAVILYDLFDPEGDKDRGIECLKYYNLTISELEKLIKMNRLNNPYKNKFTSKSKTFLKKIYGEEKTFQKNVKTYNKSEKIESTDDMDDISDDILDGNETTDKGKGKAKTKKK